MKLFKLIILAVAAASSSFGTYAQDASDPSLVAKGAKLYSENCSRCHNPRPASDYTKTEWSVVMPHMREKAHMTGKESLAVEAFISSTLTAEVRNEMKVASNDQPKKTAETLIAQFGCQGCHVVKGKGGSLGPSIDNVVSEKGREFVTKKLTNPTFDNASSAMPRYPMSEMEIETIVEFLSKE